MNRMFALAGITAISGVMMAASAVGCSSGDDHGADQGGDAGGDARSGAQHPPPTEEPQDAGPGTCPTTTPISSADIEQQLGKWASPGAVETSCEQSDIDAIKALFAKSTGGSVKYDDIKTAVSAKCKDCMFTPVAGTRWGMFVDTDQGVLDNTSGACFAIQKDDACGKARFEWETCVSVACSQKDCGTQSAVAQCIPKTFDGACKDTTTAYTAACPNEKELVAGCENIYQTIVLTCGGGADAGLDASTK